MYQKKKIFSKLRIFYQKFLNCEDCLFSPLLYFFKFLFVKYNYYFSEKKHRTNYKNLKTYLKRKEKTAPNFSAVAFLITEFREIFCDKERILPACHSIGCRKYSPAERHNIGCRKYSRVLNAPGTKQITLVSSTILHPRSRNSNRDEEWP